jgi:hypothetical protein
MKKSSLILTAMFVVLLAFPGRAQVFIEQGKVQATVKPGDNFGGDVTVNNTSNKELKVKIYWEDFLYQPPFDGNKKFLPSGTSDVSLGKWIQFSPHEAVLPPYAKMKIAYTIHLPTFAKGGYYGALFVEPETPELKMEKGVRIITRVGSLFFIETDNKSKQAVVEDIALNGATLTGKFVNKGNVILIPNVTYYIMDTQSVIADRGDLKKYYLPASQSFDFSLPLKADLASGDYTLVLTFDLDEGDVVVKEVDFTKNSDSDFILKTVRD